MTYWVQSNATRKILVGIVVLVIILGVSIPLTVFALNDDEELELTKVASAPAAATTSQVEAIASEPAAPVAPEDKSAAATEPEKVDSKTSEAVQTPDNSEPTAQSDDLLRDQIEKEAVTSISVTPAQGDEVDIVVTVYSPFEFSKITDLRVDVVREGHVWFLPETFTPAPYPSQEKSEEASFLVWEGLAVDPGETLKLEGKGRISGDDAFTISADVHGKSEVEVNIAGVAEKKR